MNQVIIFVDDEIFKFAGREDFKSFINLPSSFELEVFDDPMEAYDFVQGQAERVQLIISDYSMPACDGVNFLESVDRIASHSRKILMTNIENTEHFVDKPYIDGVVLKEKTCIESNSFFLPKQVEKIIHGHHQMISQSSDS